MNFFLDNGRTKPIPRGKKKDKSALLEMEGSESKCLIRATNGKKKISTVVRRNWDAFCSLGAVVCCMLFIPWILAYLHNKLFIFRLMQKM